MSQTQCDAAEGGVRKLQVRFGSYNKVANSEGHYNRRRCRCKEVF